MSKNKIKYLLYKLLPLRIYLKVIYFWYHGKILNLSDPSNYTEKLFWLKIYNGLPENVNLIRKVYDKYTAREYIKEKGYEENLPELYGTFNNANDIEFSSLPDKYVIKISQSNGFNFVNNGFKIDELEIKNKINSWLEYSKNLREMVKKYKEEQYYYDGNARILCEEYLSDQDGNPCQELLVFCFNGEPRLISGEVNYVDEKGNVKKEFNRNTYDIEWNFIPVNMGRERDDSTDISKPNCLDEIIECSRKLSKDFVFARVDFYLLDESFYIGEITFIPQGASKRIEPAKYDKIFGEWLDLP